MAAAEIDDAAAAKTAARAPCRLPGLVELLARQASSLADRARYAIEECLAGEPPDIFGGQPAARGVREAHG